METLISHKSCGPPAAHVLAVVLTHQRIGTVPSLGLVPAGRAALGSTPAIAIELATIVSGAQMEEARASPTPHLPKALLFVHRAFEARKKLASMRALRQAAAVVAPAPTEDPRLLPRVLASLTHPLSGAHLRQLIGRRQFHWLSPFVVRLDCQKNHPHKRRRTTRASTRARRCMRAAAFACPWLSTRAHSSAPS